MGTALAQEQTPDPAQAADAITVEPAPSAEVDESISIEKIDSRNDIPARVLFLKLEKIEDAKNYQVQLRPLKRSWAEPYQINTAREKLRIRVTPGYYEIRTRSMDERRKPGRWLAWRPFQVPFKQPLTAYPAPNSAITPKGNLNEKLSFEWPAIPSAKGYRFKLYDKSGKLIKHVVTTQNWYVHELEIKHLYYWSLNPMTSLNEADNPKFQKLWRFEITDPEKELIPVRMALAANPRTVKYQFELVKMLSDDESSEATTYESHEAVFNARLSPGEFELRVRNLYDNNTVSAWGVPTRFVVPIPNPKLISPQQAVVIDPVDDVVNSVRLEWEKSRWADRYQIFVRDEEGTLVVNEISKTNVFEAKLSHKKKYFWFVKALLPQRESRQPASVENKPPTDQQTFSIAEYIKLSLGESEEPSQLYAWGRATLANASYMAENYDNNNRVSDQVLSSTAELAAGYWHRKTSYGALVTADLSAVNIKGTTASYMQFSALLGFRKYFADQKRFRIWLGPSLKETPEVLVDGATSTLQIRVLKTLGPQVLMAFLDSFNERWGYQFYLGSFYGIQGINTPNNLKQKSYLSYFGSAYITYKLRKDMTALLGDTYQKDEAGYASADRSGNDNHVLYSGNYLSFSLIMGLQEAQK